MESTSEHRTRTRSRSPQRSSRHRGRDRNRRSDVAQISQEDYFRLNAPFRLWLRKEKDRYFDEMSSDKARQYFESFVRAWNDGRLRSRYYKQDGELSHLSKSVVTRHSWAFASNIDQRALKDIKEDVRKSTDSGGPAEIAVKQPGKEQHSRSTESERLLAEEQREEARARRKQERRRAKEREELILDEVAPKETGREAKVAKKRALNRMRHGERSLDVDIPDDELYADSADSLSALKREHAAAEQRRQERQQTRRAEPRPRDERLKEHMEKERNTIETLRAMAEQSRAQGLGMMRPPR